MLWVVKVNRRLIVMNTVNRNDVIKASDIATKQILKEINEGKDSIIRKGD